MAAVSSSSAHQAATQTAYQQLRVQQARQNADRAEQAARALQARASEAQQVAFEAQENARTLAVQSDQAQSVAVQARQGVTMINAARTMQTQLSSRVDQVIAVESSKSQSGDTKTNAPVINTTGQVTGKLVNTTA